MATECNKKFPFFEELNQLIVEYLGLHGMDTTLSSFLSECKTRNLPCPTEDATNKAHDPLSPSQFSHSQAERLLDSFDTGDLTTFTELWNTFLSYIQLTSDDMKKLEVYLRVHFGIWPKAHERPEEEQVACMNQLKEYFEQHSPELSQDPSILPLFALPYVLEPQQHPIFNELFMPNWSQRLRRQLEATLSKYFELLQENIGYQSKLAEVVMKSHTINTEMDKIAPGIVDGVTKYHQERFFQLMTTYRKTRKLLRGTRESYGKLLKVSNELISGLEGAVSGQSVKVEDAIDRCFEIFPELFSPDGSGKPDKEYFKKLTGTAVFDTVLDSDVSLFFIGISDLSPDSLDYLKIKSTLIGDQNGGQVERLCLLQALRWLLTKCTVNSRKIAIDAFVEGDLLGLHDRANTEYREKLFSLMTSPVPTYAKECFARLLNTFASIKAGRDYLASTTFSIEYLVNSLNTFKSANESYICQMVVATLQKLSLRKKMRLEMIKRGVIEWLTSYLKSELVKKDILKMDHCDESNKNNELAVSPVNHYLMEYGWALFMNLCLHDEAKPICSAIATDILGCVIQTILSKPSKEVAPYVVSTLYSLLRAPEIYGMAQGMNLQDTLKEVIENDKTEMGQHLGQLTDTMKTQGLDRLPANGEIDYDDSDNADPNEFEPELEVPEAWVGTLDLCSPTGDDLLIRHYLVHRPDPIVPIVVGLSETSNVAQKHVNGGQKRGVILRPTTPKVQSQSIPLAFTPSSSNKGPSNESTGTSTTKKLPKKQQSLTRRSAPSIQGGDEAQKASGKKSIAKMVSSKQQPTPTTTTKPPAMNSKSNPSPDPVLRKKVRTKNRAELKLETERLETNNNSDGTSTEKSTTIGNDNTTPGKPDPETTSGTTSTMDVDDISGKCNEFDEGMYYDDIFASPQNPRATKPKYAAQSEDKNNSKKNNTKHPDSSLTTIDSDDKIAPRKPKNVTRRYYLEGEY